MCDGRVPIHLWMHFQNLKKDDYITERLYVYAFMRYYEDTSDGTYQQMSGKSTDARSKDE